MSEFQELEQEMRTIFADIEKFKEKTGVTSVMIESTPYTDRFHISCRGKRSYTGAREYRYTRSSDKEFTQVK